MLEQNEKEMLDKIISDERSAGPFTGMIFNAIIQTVVTGNCQIRYQTDDKIEDAIRLALRVKIVAKRLLD